MKRELMDVLACPLCRNNLALQVFEEKEDEIIKGSLQCTSCSETYLITDAIPNLLPPELRE